MPRTNETCHIEAPLCVFLMVDISYQSSRCVRCLGFLLEIPWPGRVQSTYILVYMHMPLCSFLLSTLTLPTRNTIPRTNPLPSPALQSHKHNQLFQYFHMVRYHNSKEKKTTANSKRNEQDTEDQKQLTNTTRAHAHYIHTLALAFPDDNTREQSSGSWGKKRGER